MISVFDIFKIGVGPSSSHTVGPMRTGKQLIDSPIVHNLFKDVTRVVVDVCGSLFLTDKGHHTDIAIIMGLAGDLLDTVGIDSTPSFIQDVNIHDRLVLANDQHEVKFPVNQYTSFHADNLSLHESDMRITAPAGDKVVCSQTYYSIGGGFIVDEEHFGRQDSASVEVPYPYNSATDLQKHYQETGPPLSDLMMKNELALHSREGLEWHLTNVWKVMHGGIEHGISTEGVLPNKLCASHRAAVLRRMLVGQDKATADPVAVVDWINMLALAVNEENTAGGHVVTAPANGACRIIPATLTCYDKFTYEANANSLARYLLVASAIDSLYKMNALISGAGVGCQDEASVTYSMAVAGLAGLLGANLAQVCTAMKIAMEHNLGLTCNPVIEQVQMPCTERNAIAAIKAMNATRMALRRTSEPRVCLDRVIGTMYETGKDVNAEYRKTSRGGLTMKTAAYDQSPSKGPVSRSLSSIPHPAVVRSGTECYPYHLIFEGVIVVVCLFIVDALSLIRCIHAIQGSSCVETCQHALDRLIMHSQSAHTATVFNDENRSSG